jgi:hypothetical protein
MLILALISLRYIAPYFFSLAPKYMITLVNALQGRDSRRHPTDAGVRHHIAVLSFPAEVHLLLPSNALVVLAIGLAYRGHAQGIQGPSDHEVKPT